MGDGHKVDTEDLVAYAREVENLSQRLQKASSKGSGVDIGIGTFGIIGQFFSEGVRADIAGTAESISDLASGLSSVSEAVKTCADAYDRMESDAAKDFEARLRGLDNAGRG